MQNVINKLMTKSRKYIPKAKGGSEKDDNSEGSTEDLNLVHCQSMVTFDENLKTNFKKSLQLDFDKREEQYPPAMMFDIMQATPKVRRIQPFERGNWDYYPINNNAPIIEGNNNKSGGRSKNKFKSNPDKKSRSHQIHKNSFESFGTSLKTIPEGND